MYLLYEKETEGLTSFSKDTQLEHKTLQYFLWELSPFFVNPFCCANFILKLEKILKFLL